MHSHVPGEVLRRNHFVIAGFSSYRGVKLPAPNTESRFAERVYWLREPNSTLMVRRRALPEQGPLHPETHGWS
jgi:hypothetical protein